VAALNPALAAAMAAVSVPRKLIYSLIWLTLIVAQHPSRLPIEPQPF
jgi:hypothetical protein